MKYVDKSLGIIDAIILSLAFYKLICFMQPPMDTFLKSDYKKIIIVRGFGTVVATFDKWLQPAFFIHF